MNDLEDKAKDKIDVAAKAAKKTTAKVADVAKDVAHADGKGGDRSNSSGRR